MHISVRVCILLSLVCACAEPSASATTSSPAKRLRGATATATATASGSATASRAGGGAGVDSYGKMVRAGTPAASSASLSESALISAAVQAAKSGGSDPVLAYGCGLSRTAFSPPTTDKDAYERMMKEEAYNTMEELKVGHYYKASASGGAGASMKRHMRVSAEMANLASLAINYPSSILVRQDEANMDFLRACVTGPADTPYMNGLFLFDIFLPPTFPQVSPSVILTTTGAGRARFNPNL